MLHGTALNRSSSSGLAAKGGHSMHGSHGDLPIKAILLSSVPALSGSLAAITCAWHSDKTDEKHLHVALPWMLSGALLTLFGPMVAISFVTGFVTLVLAKTFSAASSGVMSSLLVGEWSEATRPSNGCNQAVGAILVYQCRLELADRHDYCQGGPDGGNDLHIRQFHSERQVLQAGARAGRQHPCDTRSEMVTRSTRLAPQKPCLESTNTAGLQLLSDRAEPLGWVVLCVPFFCPAQAVWTPNMQA